VVRSHVGTAGTSREGGGHPLIHHRCSQELKATAARPCSMVATASSRPAQTDSCCSGQPRQPLPTTSMCYCCTNAQGHSHGLLSTEMSQWVLQLLGLLFGGIFTVAARLRN
jgi:hypothetical protein